MAITFEGKEIPISNDPIPPDELEALRYEIAVHAGLTSTLHNYYLTKRSQGFGHFKAVKLAVKEWQEESEWAEMFLEEYYSKYPDRKP